MAEYENVAKGKLKLKNDFDLKKRKKKKKAKEQEKLEKAVQESRSNSEGTKTVRELTQAEMAFKKMQEKMQKKRILEMASMTHKQRVEKFNEHLDGLTEHFDIPKVSWTK